MIITETYTVNFPAAIECAFNEQGSTPADLNDEGNGPRINGWIMARIEQYQSVPFPDDATLCDAEFHFPEQTMHYDDEIFLTLNHNVLISSVNYSTAVSDPAYANGLEINDLGLMRYNWLGDNALYNLPYKQTGKYCLGLSPSDPDYHQKCNIPSTDIQGQMKLDLPSNEAIKIGMSEKSYKMEFGFITVGDNDNGDCEHSAYSFDVTMKYFINQ